MSSIPAPPLPEGTPEGVGWLAEHLPPEERLARLLHNVGEHFESLFEILVQNKASGPTRQVLLDHIAYEEQLNDRGLAAIEPLLPDSLKGIAAIGRQHSAVVRSFASRPGDLAPDLMDHMLRHFLEEHAQLPGAEEPEEAPHRGSKAPVGAGLAGDGGGRPSKPATPATGTATPASATATAPPAKANGPSVSLQNAVASGAGAPSTGGPTHGKTGSAGNGPANGGAPVPPPAKPPTFGLATRPPAAPPGAPAPALGPSVTIGSLKGVPSPASARA